MADVTDRDAAVAQDGPGSAGTEGVSGQSADVGPGVRVVRRRRSIWDDRMVRAMGYGAAVLIVLYLLTVVSALYLGFIGSERAPMTVTEREVMAWESVTSDPESPVTAEQWQSYVLALVADGQLQRAQQVINRVNADATIDQSQGAHMLYGEGVLRSTEGRHEDALAAFTAAMEAAVEAYEEELARGDAEGPNWAMAMGLHPNYYRSALERAVIYREQARWSEGIEMLDIYLEGNPQSAGVLVDRAYLKIQVDDLDGAEADYRQALRYVPDFQEALDGLQQIGVGE